MKKTIVTISLAFVGLSGFAQLIARVEMKDPVPGICDNNHVYALFHGFKGQVEPACSLSNQQIQDLLNEKVRFLKDNPKFKGKGMAGVYINCKGEALDWEISVKTKNDQLDQEILEVFKTLQTWTAGTLDGQAVDTRELMSYKIKMGVLTLE